MATSSSRKAFLQPSSSCAQSVGPRLPMPLSGAGRTARHRPPKVELPSRRDRTREALRRMLDQTTHRRTMMGLANLPPANLLRGHRENWRSIAASVAGNRPIAAQTLNRAFALTLIKQERLLQPAPKTVVPVPARRAKRLQGKARRAVLLQYRRVKVSPKALPTPRPNLGGRPATMRLRKSCPHQDISRCLAPTRMVS